MDCGAIFNDLIAILTNPQPISCESRFNEAKKKGPRALAG
jgi:hypothetical protein